MDRAESAADPYDGWIPSPLDAVADMRATAKWTVGAFAAVGALVLGGLPLALVSTIKDRGDAATVAVGMIVALFGVCWAIWHTAESLTPPITILVDLHDPQMRSLRQLISRDPAAFFGGFGTDEQHLHDALVWHCAVLDRLVQAVAAEQVSERRLIWERALTVARANVARAQRAQSQLLAFVHTWQVREALRRARRRTFVGAIVCTIGVFVAMSATLH